MKQLFYTISDVVEEASTTYYKVHYLIRSGKFKEQLEKKGGQYILTEKQKNRIVTMLRKYK